MVRLVVGEDSYLVQQGIEQVLATMPEIELVAMCETTAQLERTIEAGGVDVVMTDIRMPRPFALAALGIGLVRSKTAESVFASINGKILITQLSAKFALLPTSREVIFGSIFPPGYVRQ